MDESAPLLRSETPPPSYQSSRNIPTYLRIGSRILSLIFPHNINGYEDIEVQAMADRNAQAPALANNDVPQNNNNRNDAAQNAVELLRNQLQPGIVIVDYRLNKWVVFGAIGWVLPAAVALGYNMCYSDGAFACSTVAGNGLMSFVVGAIVQGFNNQLSHWVRDDRAKQFIPALSLTLGVVVGAYLHSLCSAPSPTSMS